MDFRHSLKKLAQRTALPIFICAIIVYFVVQLYVGDTGLPTHNALRDRLAEANAELAELQARERVLERDIALIDMRQINPRLLNEIARDKLKLVAPDELVVMRR